MQQPSTRIAPPPQDIDAESSILASCLLDEKCVPEAINEISSDDFYQDSNKRIFKAVESLFREGEPVELVTAMNHLRSTKELDSVGGPSYLAHLSSIPASPSRITAYCNIVREKAQARKLISLSQEMSSDCFQGLPIKEIVETSSNKFFSIAVDRNSKVQSVGEASKAVVSEIEQRFKDKKSIVGIPTGLADIDRNMHGLLNSELIIVAGRPSMGKTTLALNFMYHAAERGFPCLFFSLEMSRREIVEKYYSFIGRIDHDRILSGNLQDTDWPKLKRAQGIMNSIPIFIDDQGALPITQIRARARLYKAKYGIKLIVVDYLQLIKAKAENRTNEITEISGQLKAIAKELDIPVIAISQLSRNCESRPDKRPLMSDLRDSGAIEQDANIIMFVYRDEVYNDSEDNPLRGIAEVIVSKIRRGRKGTYKLAFQGEYSCFENLANWS